MIIISKNIFFPNVQVANNFTKRLFGLMGKKKVPEQGLFLINCSRIHTCFMRTTIDAVYLNDSFKIIYKETLKPWRIGKKVFNAKHVLELSENESKKFILHEYMTCKFN